MISHCSICKRLLEQDDDPLSVDCGGDCWGCVGEIEAELGVESSLDQCRNEFRDGLRSDWMPPPEVESKYSNDGGIMEIHTILKTPLGEPWKNETFEFGLYENVDGTEVDIDIKILKTNHDGVAVYSFDNHSNGVGVWCRISRKENQWRVPIARQQQ